MTQGWTLTEMAGNRRQSLGAIHPSLVPVATGRTVLG